MIESREYRLFFSRHEIVEALRQSHADQLIVQSIPEAKFVIMDVSSDGVTLRWEKVGPERINKQPPVKRKDRIGG